jgi:hypothetical protein
MKTASIISWFALLLSTIALAWSLSRPSPLTEADIEKLVDIALIEREKEFVAKLRPDFQSMFSDMTDDPESQEWTPQTIEELVAPLVKITSQIVEE